MALVVRDLRVKDFKGQERDYKLFFNMTEAEIMEYEFGEVSGGISEFYSRILRAQDTPSIMQAIRKLILKAYGVPSADGSKFQKSKEISEQFTFTQAYSDFVMKLYTDDKYSQRFLHELIPQETIQKILDRVEANKAAAEGNGTVVSMEQHTQAVQAPVTEQTSGPVIPGAPTTM